MIDYSTDPDIQRAVDAGYSLEQIANPHTQGDLGEAIQAAAEKYGPRSDEMQAAIDVANAAAVMLTNARAAYNRIKAEG